jgi:two-component system NtrC family sensor kinase
VARRTARGRGAEEATVSKPRWYQSLSLRIIVTVSLTAVVVNLSFGWVYLTIEERHLGALVLGSAGRLSETIAKSVRFDMLENRKEHAYGIMRTIGSQPGIERVRVFGGEGKILFSTDAAEIGTIADKRGEACYACHAEDRPLERLTTRERSRTFHGADGHRVIGMITPIANEPGCAREGCHLAPARQKILGVLDVTLSLADVDRDLQRGRSRLVLSQALAVVCVAVILVLLLLRLVVRPVDRLVEGTTRVAAGDLHCAIPVARDDEMGHLARSFNHMTERLAKADEELHAAQAELLRSAKLAAVGRMAATVAHEINNPLAGVYTYLRLADRRISQGKTGETDIQKLREHLAVMAREVERATTVVLNLLDFTRPREPVKTPVRVNDVLDETLQVFAGQLAATGVRLSLELGDLPVVSADPAQLKLVFSNIVANACDAMPQGGELRVRSRRGDAPDTVEVAFVDTGPGIPTEIGATVFDPFVTTKERGTGLGLTVAYEVVARHRGRLEARREPGAGARLVVVLPVS